MKPQTPELLWHPLRRKWVHRTPEEEVKIRILQYLLQKGYSPARLQVEYFFSVATAQKRADIVAFDVQGKPYLVIECKAPSVPLNRPAFEQIACYLYTLSPRYYALTNGKVTYIFELPSQTPLKDLPPPN